MKKICFFALSMFIAVISFSACGNEDDDESKNDKENSSCECDKKDNESKSNSSDETNYDFEYRILTDSTVAIEGFNIVPMDMIIPDKVKIKGKNYIVTVCGGKAYESLYVSESIEIPQTVTKICSLSAKKNILHKSQEDIVQMKKSSFDNFNNVNGDLYFTEGTAGYGQLTLKDGETYTATNSLKNFSFKFSSKDYYIEEYGYQNKYTKLFIKIDGFNEELEVGGKYLHWDGNKFYTDSDSSSDGFDIREDFDDTNVVAAFEGNRIISPSLCNRLATDKAQQTCFNIK